MKKNQVFLYCFCLGVFLATNGCTSKKTAAQDKMDAAELTGGSDDSALADNGADATADNSADAQTSSDGSKAAAADKSAKSQDLSDDFGDDSGNSQKSADASGNSQAASGSSDQAANSSDDLSGLDDLSSDNSSGGANQGASADASNAAAPGAAGDNQAAAPGATDNGGGADSNAALADNGSAANGAAPDQGASATPPDQSGANAAGSPDLASSDPSASQGTADAGNSAPADASAPSGADDAGLPSAAPAPHHIIPLQKIASAPFKRHGILLNAVYIARPGDTLASVSQKIYGAKKIAELKKANPLYRHRNLRVGDKVYYNSPKRPTDDTQLLTYYEDQGLAPQIYESQPGDNIRTVAKNLLGNKNSWKEIWATNPDLESKGDLPEGTKLRYWPTDTSAATNTLADNSNPAAGSDTSAQAPGAPAAPDMSDKAPDASANGNQAANANPANPANPVEAGQPPNGPDQDQKKADGSAAATVAGANPTPPPPPPPAAAAPAPVPPPPPPQMAPPPPMAHHRVPVNDNANGMFDDPNQTMLIGVGAILLLAAIAMFIIIRKRRSKRNIDFQTATHTQID